MFIILKSANFVFILKSNVGWFVVLEHFLRENNKLIIALLDV